MPDDPTPEPAFDAETDAALKEAYAFAPAAAEAAAAKFRLPEPRRRIPWIPMAAAAAVGLLVGYTLLPARVTMIEVAVPEKRFEPLVAGFVAMATKSLLDGTGGRAVSTGSPVHQGETIQVPADGRASLILSDGTEVRLDRGTRVTLGESRLLAGAARDLDLASGRIWMRVTEGSPFLVGAGEMRVTVLGTELSVSRGMEKSEVQLFSGAARVEAAGVTRDLVAGQEVEFGHKLSDARKIYSEAIATGWMLELYAYAGRHERDLADHMDRMLSEMGRRKMAHLEERAIVEELGPVCRVPIARFLVSESARTETEARRKAGRVLERIADATVATELAAALRDADAEVRVSAARAVRRVSAGAACAEPEAFRPFCDEGSAAAADAWAKSCSPPPGK